MLPRKKVGCNAEPMQTVAIIGAGPIGLELAVALNASYAGEPDLAVGNAVGSNIFNILLILGVTSVVPEGDIPVTAELAFIDIPVMLAATLLGIFFVPLFFVMIRQRFIRTQADTVALPDAPATGEA